MTQRLPVHLLAALATVLPLAASALTPDPEFVIQIRDHHFIPAETQVPAGVKVRIVLDNQDAIAEEFDSHALNREKHVPARTRVTLFIGPLDPGRYVFESESDAPGGPALGIIIAR